MATIAGGSISSISGGKFANWGVTAAMAYAFNQIASSGGQSEFDAARQKGGEILDPMMSGWDPSDPDYHHYSVGPSELCAVGDSGCSFSMAEPIVAKGTVPFPLRYSGPGAYNLPYGLSRWLGGDPIMHFNPSPGTWLNITEYGHRYHPGSVGHALYESGGKMCEPSRLSRRLQPLREWSHEHYQQEVIEIFA